MLADKKNNGLDCTYVTVDEKCDKISPPGIGIRHLQMLLLFLCYAIAYGMRTSMSVAVVAMSSNSTTTDEFQKFEWTKQIQDVVMSSFFWGYVTMQIPSGFIAVRFGGKIPIFIAMILNGFLSVMTPLAAGLGGWQAVCACRVLQGLSQGLIIPSVHTLIGRWVPTEERGRLGASVHGASHIGAVIFLGMSGILAGSSLGWPSIFYIQGAMSLVAGVLWCYLGANCPDEHKKMHEVEKLYIKKSLGHTVKKKLPIAPWSLILRSPPVLAICIGHIGESWGNMTLMTEIPAYMSKVMNLDIQKSGLLAALPFMGKWLTMFVFSFGSDALVNSGKLSLGSARKIANTLGSWPVMIGLLCLAYVPPNIVIVETLLVLTLSMSSALNLGCLINHIDLSPNYSGPLISLSNSMANTFGLLAPITAGIILTDDTDVNLWRHVFFISAAVFFVTNLLYIIFGSADVQPWNDPEYTKNLKEEKKAIKMQYMGATRDSIDKQKEENFTLLQEKPPAQIALSK